jgi:hypothetical protein
MKWFAQMSAVALRGLLWTGPKYVAKRTAYGYLATVEDVGRRWLALAGFGIWVYAIWWAAHATGILGFQQFAAFLALVWLWRALAVTRWTWHLRVERSRARAIQRRELDLLEQIGTRVSEWGQRVPEGVAVLRSVKPDEGYQTAKKNGRDQAEQVRQWNADNPTFKDLPMGDQFEPVWRLPKRFRRKSRKGDTPGDA